MNCNVDCFVFLVIQTTALLQGVMASKGKILFVVTSNDELGSSGKQTGWYFPEVAHSYYVFKNASYEIDFVSPRGGISPVDKASEDAFKHDTTFQMFNATGDRDALLNTKKPLEVNASDYKVIFYAGGHGPMFDLPHNDDIATLCVAVYKDNGVVAAVGHGTVGLIPVRNPNNGENLVKDKFITGFTNNEEDAVQRGEFMPFLLETRLKELGAKFVSLGNFAPNVQESERIMTGQNPASAKPLAEKVVKFLENEMI